MMKRRVPKLYDSDRLHLTSREVERLLESAKGSRNEIRDRCLMLLAFRHGLRVSEACRLKLDQVDPESRVLHVSRLKCGLSTTHPLRADELRAIGAWLKVRATMKVAVKVKAFFVSQQRKPLHRSTVNLLIEKIQRGGLLTAGCPPAHAPSCLRIRPSRPGRRYPAHSRLPRPPQHPAYGSIHGIESGAFSEALAVVQPVS
jgi:type 1 fimbriae regulatory protein FimB